MIILNMTNIRFLWFPNVKRIVSGDFYCLDIRWIGFQLCFYNAAAAHAIAAKFNA